MIRAVCDTSLTSCRLGAGEYVRSVPVLGSSHVESGGPMSRARSRSRRKRSTTLTIALVVTATMVSFGHVESADAARRRHTEFPKFEARTLDGFGSNSAHREWALAGTPYLRVAPANYADRSGSMVAGPNARVVSNRVFNDIGQNLFSETGESQWGWTWGQFLDHDLDLTNASSGNSFDIAPGSATDPISWLASPSPRRPSRASC